MGGFYFCYTIFGANNSVLSTKIERKLIVEMWMSVLVQNLSGLAICKDQLEIDLQRKNFFQTRYATDMIWTSPEANMNCS